MFEVANQMLENITHHHANDWPLPPEAQRAAATVSATHPTTRLAEASA